MLCVERDVKLYSLTHAVVRVPSFNVFFLSREPKRISAQTLYCQKLESLPKICAADSMCLPLLVFTQLFFECRTVGSSQTGAQTEFNAK